MVKTLYSILHRSLDLTLIYVLRDMKLFFCITIYNILIILVSIKIILINFKMLNKKQSIIYFRLSKEIK